MRVEELVLQWSRRQPYKLRPPADSAPLDRQPTNGLITATIVWFVLIFGVAGHGFFFPRSHTVFDIYGPAAQRWWAGEPLYAPFVRSWTEDGKPASTTEHYRYCPLFAMGMSPFAALPDSFGNALWKACNGCFFVMGLWYAGRRLFPKPLTNNEMAGFLLLAAPVALHSLYNGQANLLVVGAVLFGYGAAASERWGLAALWIALATLTKGYPLAAGLLVCAIYPVRFAPRYIAAIATGLLLPFLTQSPSYVLEQTASWFRHMTASPTLMRERQRSIDNLLQAWGFPITPQNFAVYGIVAAVCVLALCLITCHAHRSGWACESNTQRHAHHAGPLTWSLLLYSAWVALFGQATESCTYAVMAPAVAILLIKAFRAPGRLPARLALVVSLIMMGPLVTDMFGPTVRGFAVRHGSQPLGAVIFLAVTLIWLFRSLYLRRLSLSRSLAAASYCSLATASFSCSSSVASML